MHEDLLSRHSEFFKAALTRGKWKEQQDRLVSLPEHNVEAFNIFQHFLYTGSIFSAREGDVTKTDTLRDREYSRFERCWKLGEQLMSTTFKDAITDALIAKVVSEDSYPAELYDSVYSALSSTSAIRKLFVDIAVWGWSHETVCALRDAESKHVDFLCDVAIKLHWYKTWGSSEAPYLSEDTCIYHEHVAENKPCYKTMF